MKRVDRTFRCLAAGLLAGVALGLGSGCASSASSNRRVYDRYAELVAARNRTQPESEKATAAPAAPRAEPAKPVEAAEPPKSKPGPAKPAPEKTEPAKPTPPKAKPEPAKSVPPVVVAPEIRPEPEPVPPVQVLVPQPTEPARSVPGPAPEPSLAPPAPPPAPDEPPARSPAASPVVDGRPSSADSAAYLLKVGDLVQIFLRGIPGGEAIEDIIDEDGQITLPLINEVQAAGTTPSELERAIRKIYLDLDIYRNISVTVVVPARYYFIQGEIRAPGRFQITSAMRVSQAIAGAGGYSEYASGRVIVKRGGKIIKNIRNARRLERTPEDDILLEPDDIVEVRRSLW